MANFRFFQAQESDPSGSFQQYARSGEYIGQGIQQAGAAIAGAFERNLAMRQQRAMEREKFDRELAMRDIIHAQSMKELEQQDAYARARQDDEQSFRADESARDRDAKYDLEDMQADRVDRREMGDNARMLMQSRIAAETANRPYQERADRERRATEARTAAMHLFASKDSSPVFSAKVPPKAMGAITRGMKPEDFDAYVGGMYDPESAKQYQKAAGTPQDVSWIDEDSWAKHSEVFGNRWGQEGLDALEEARKAYGHEIGIEKAYEGAFGKFEKQLGGMPNRRAGGASGESSRTPVPVEGAPTLEQFGRMASGQQQAVLRVVAAKLLRQNADQATQNRWADDPEAKRQDERAALEEARALYGIEDPAPSPGGQVGVPSSPQMPPLEQNRRPRGGTLMPELPGGEPAVTQSAPQEPQAASGSLDDQIRSAIAEDTPQGRQRARELFLKALEQEKAQRPKGPPSGEGWKQVGEQKWERPSILGGTSTFERTQPQRP